MVILPAFKVRRCHSSALPLFAGLALPKPRC